MRYNLIHPNGQVESGLSPFAIRVGAMVLQCRNKVRPDLIEELHLPLAITILQRYGYDIERID